MPVTVSGYMNYMNCVSGLYPSSGVSRTNKIEKIKNKDKR
jgi:hypothetical protein